MQKKLKALLSFIMAVSMVFISAGCSSQAANTNLVNVKVATADKHKLQTTLNVAGTLVPDQIVNVLSKISGQVTGMSFNIGDNVKAGDTLITLETKTLNSQLQQAEASLQSAEAAAQSARIQVDQAKINLDTATKAYNNIKALYDAGAVAQSQLDDVAAKLSIAQKQYELASGPSQNQAAASVNVARANINNIKVQMDNATIASPISGVITNRNINVGEIASPGVALVTIADTSTLKLKGTVSQDVLPLIKAGQDIDVTVDIYSGKVFKGKVDNVGPMAVSTGTYFPIEISIKNTGDIKAGLSAHASLSMTGDEVIIVPASAVVQNNGQSYVFVIKNNVAMKRVVETGLSSDKEIEVIKGLDAGEQVAVTNVNNIFDNMPVSIN